MQSQCGKEEGKNKNWLGSLDGVRVLESSLVTLLVLGQIFTSLLLLKGVMVFRMMGFSFLRLGKIVSYSTAK